MFFDMKDGTKPEGSVLITHCGCMLQRSTPVIHLRQKTRGIRCSKELTDGVNISCKN